MHHETWIKFPYEFADINRSFVDFLFEKSQKCGCDLCLSFITEVYAQQLKRVWDEG